MPRKRNNQVKIYLSDEEYEKFNKKVELSKLSKTDFFVKCITGKKITIVDGLRETLIELKRIGVNLNQISKNLNSGVFQNAIEDIKLIKTSLSNVLDLIIKILRGIK